MTRNLTAPGAALGVLLASCAMAGTPRLELHQGDHVCLIGNTLADRMQHSAWLETLIHQRFPDLDLTWRNLGFAGDELTMRHRSQDFGPVEVLGEKRRSIEHERDLLITQVGCPRKTSNRGQALSERLDDHIILADELVDDEAQLSVSHRPDDHEPPLLVTGCA